MTTVQDFLSSNEITGALTPAQAAQLLELPQGDTASAEQADPPVSAPAPEPSPAATEKNTTKTDPAEDLSAENAVILARDGKHTIPFDKRSPFVTSGIRLGTPAATTRGMREPQMEIIGRIIARVLRQHEQPGVLETARAEVAALTLRFPVP